MMETEREIYTLEFGAERVVGIRRMAVVRMNLGAIIETMAVSSVM